jgi:hypothetical protein
VATVLAVRYSDTLRRLLELQGPLRLELLEELRATVVLESDRPEWFYLRKETLNAGFIDVLSAAGTLSEGGLFNPTGSGRLGVVTRASLQILTGVADVLRRYITALPGGALVNNSGVRDTRSRPGGPFVLAGGSTLQVFQAAVAAADGGVADQQWRMQPAATQLLPTEAILRRGEVVLTPGTGVIFTVGAVGVNTLRGNFDWYEKLLAAEA